PEMGGRCNPIIRVTEHRGVRPAARSCACVLWRPMEPEAGRRSPKDHEGSRTAGHVARRRAMKPRKREVERRAVQLILTWQGRYLWFFAVRCRERPTALDPERMGSEREDGSEFGRGGGRPASRIPIDGRERRNVVRFELKEEQMERKEFSIEVLQKTLKFIPGEIDFLFAFPGKTTFEVVFKTRYLYDKCVRTVEREKEVNLILDKFLIVPLSDRLDKKVNVIMYTEKVKIQDISTWLLQYCDVKTSMQMTDDDGIKNGLYKFDIILKKERDTDRVIHLPPVIQIGAVRGHVFYPGQPQVCRRCGKEGHKVLECIVVKCRNCKEEGHSTRECRKQIICNLCGQEAHAFKDCPVSYANIVKNGVGHKESGGS
uniref:CCHC-type domain-containing protein n=1 Tax=Erpetoichthys calabaricus TaxID=27687 RepID=A0A8C4SRQ4_ERPCA